MTTIEWRQGNSAGPHRSPVTKLLLHTTEGGSIEGAIAAYVANNSWPHWTVDSRRDRICRHLPFDVSARALRNLAGGVETNTAGVIQVEIVGQAADPAGIGWEWIGREVVGPICREVGIPVQSSVQWVAYPQSYGTDAPQRLGFNQWTVYMGVLGHQHCPENTHGDPGLIPIELILDAAQPAKPPPPSSHPPVLEDDMEAILWNPANNTFWYLSNLPPERFVIQVTGDAAGKLAGKDGVRNWTHLDAQTVEAFVNEVGSDVVVNVDLVDAADPAVAASLAG